MKWTEIRAQYPNQWLLIEAVQAHSEAGERILEDLNALESFSDSVAAMHKYAELHHQAPRRELYIFHSSREYLKITERAWLGIRTVA
jgi:hypothetical protein